MFTPCAENSVHALWKGSDSMISLIMLIIAVILAAVGIVFIFKRSDNIKRDNIKIAITFFKLATITAITAVILSMFSSGAPLP